jgi:hypothetical protein
MDPSWGMLHGANGTVLITLGHPQPPNPIQTDNSTANGILNSIVKQKWSKTIDMRFYWLRDHIDQKQFLVAIGLLQ